MLRLRGSRSPERRTRRRRLPVVAVATLAALAAWVPVSAQTVAITGGTVHPVSGPTLEEGVVVIRDGRIQAVGAVGEVEVPADARRVDASGRVVTPGLFDLGTQTGLVEVGAVPSTRDASAGGDPVRAAFRVRDGLNPRSVVIPLTRAGGLTTVASSPTGGIVSGLGAVLDLVEPGGELIAREPAALYVALGPDAAESAGGARGAVALRLREALDDADFFGDNREAYLRGASRPMAVSRLDLEALLGALEGTYPVVFRASRASDIRAALGIAREFGLRAVIEGGEEAWLMTDELAEAGVPVVLKPLFNLPADFDRLGSRFENAAFLEEAGVPVVISTLDTHEARLLPQEAGNAVRYGMSWAGALRAVTLAPAEALGLGDDYGSLEPGKVANVVVWSGDPFELSTFAERVFVRGRETSLDHRQRRLLERYLELEAPLPPAYRGKEGNGGGG